MEEKEDRLSDLPDPLVHHILSFLPSTKEAIQTSVLSKRWRHQWTRVPNLIFDFSDSGMTSDFSPENISHISSTVSKIIDDTLALHDCSKLQKFHITFECYDHTQDPNYDAKLRFATRKQVEDLILECRRGEWLRLPSFFFRLTSLVKLRLFYCSIMPMGIVQFESLKDLCLQCCYCEYEAIRSIVSGSPLLQSLEIWYCYGSNPLVISSKSLKKLVLIDISWYVDISCPNLVEFQVRAAYCCISGWCETVLEELLSESPLLESLEWEHFEVPKLRIASKILKKLALTGMIPHEIEISCPFLEDLDLSGYMMNPPSSARAALDLNTYNEGSRENVARQILEQLQHLNKLKLGSSFIEILSALEMSGLSYPLLNHKSLSLEGPIFAHIPGIVCALRSSPVLERLVVKLQPCKRQNLADLSDLDHFGDNCWNLNGTSFNSLMSHLRTVEITRFSQGEDKPKLVLDFVEFLLKNASVLEKMVVILEDCETDFVIKVSQMVLSFPRCCSDAIVEVSCSN